MKKSFSKNLATAFIVLALLVAAPFGFGYYQFRAPGPLSEVKTVIIPRGEGVMSMVETLRQEGVIRYGWPFVAGAAVTEQLRGLKAGEYLFTPNMTPSDVLGMMAKGEVVVHKVTVPEGLTTREIIALLNRQPELVGKIEGDISEGSLLPETYHFLRGDDRMMILRRMQSAQADLLKTLWEGRQEGLPFATPQEAVALASIVEKETGLPRERSRVAAVFENRLKTGMKLQADPTVAYGLGKFGASARRLTGDDLRAPSAYNSYLNEGLPPTPIANPGRASLEAVFKPEVSEELFFVATGRGGHRFARTLAEHNRNVGAYRDALEQARAERETPVEESAPLTEE